MMDNLKVFILIFVVNLIGLSNVYAKQLVIKVKLFDSKTVLKGEFINNFASDIAQKHGVTFDGVHYLSDKDYNYIAENYFKNMPDVVEKHPMRLSNSDINVLHEDFRYALSLGASRYFTKEDENGDVVWNTDYPGNVVTVKNDKFSRYIVDFEFVDKTKCQGAVYFGNKSFRDGQRKDYFAVIRFKCSFIVNTLQNSAVVTLNILKTPPNLDMERFYRGVLFYKKMRPFIFDDRYIKKSKSLANSITSSYVYLNKSLVGDARNYVKKLVLSDKNEFEKAAKKKRAAVRREKERARIEKNRREKIRTIVINKFRKNLKSSDDSHCGLVVSVKGSIARVETPVGLKWLKVTQLYPPGFHKCKFYNNVYVD